MSEARTKVGSPVYMRLAQRLRTMVAEEHANGLSGAERFTVVHVTPTLVIEHLRSDLVLEDGDPDFTVGAWLRQYMLQYTLVVGDSIWCVREGLEWTAIDVVDPGSQVAI